MDYYPNRFIDYPPTGTRYGLWEFRAPGEGYRWLMRCICGSVKEVRSQDVRQGATRSCGCDSSFGVSGGSANLKHGTDYGSKLYRTWRNAKNRCFNPKAEKYKDYGAIGISMCPEWANDFTVFAAAVGEPPSARHSLDRIKNHIGYQPGNVKWSTPMEQSNNTRRNVNLEHEGITQSMSAWARATGIPTHTIGYRIRAGWSIEKALTTPPRKS